MCHLTNSTGFFVVVSFLILKFIKSIRLFHVIPAIRTGAMIGNMLRQLFSKNIVFIHSSVVQYWENIERQDNKCINERAQRNVNKTIKSYICG